MKKLLFLLVCALLLLAPAAVASAGPASNDDSDIGLHLPDWMGALSGDLKISELSIPGTHDSMSLYGGSEFRCQSTSLDTQLEAGIRSIDIRCVNTASSSDGHDYFAIFHSYVYQEAVFGADVLDKCQTFLSDHPTETILMRIRKENPDDPNCHVDFNKTFEWYESQYPELFWNGWDSNWSVPKLGDVRGKIVVLQDFPGGDDQWGHENHYGLSWEKLEKQDHYLLTGAFEIEAKWSDWVLPMMVKTDGGDRNDMYLNLFNATGPGIWPVEPPAFPYSVASGQVPGAPDCNGVNQSAYWLLSSSPFRLVGVCSMDFPGPGLIRAIIDLNPWRNPPSAEAGGPYTVPEGTPLTLSAAASSDPDGDPLTYRWDFNNDGVMDTRESSDPTTTWTWHDDRTQTVCVRVSDGLSSSDDTAVVTVTNVSPTLTIASQSSHAVDEGSEASLIGLIRDPGVHDSFALEVDWGEGAPVTHQFPEGSTYPGGWRLFEVRHRYLDDNPTGTLADTYAVSVTLTDDDGGVDTGAMDVVVNNLAPSASIDSVEQPDPYIILPVVHELTFNGSFADTGTQDTHTAVWDWGDGSSAAATVNEASGSGTVSGRHTFQAPGTYTVTLRVTDDDTAPATATRTVTVLSADQATTSLCSYVAGLPNSAFAKVASQRRSALVSKLNLAVQAIKAGSYQGAVSSLTSDVRAKADGIGSDDWVINPGARVAICRMIDGTCAYMKTLIIK